MKIYRSGNYLVIEFPNGEKISNRCKEINFSKIPYVENKYLYTYLGITPTSYDWREFTDQSGAAFASESDFETFINANTGNFNTRSSGGGDIDPLDYDLADFNNLSSNPFVRGTAMALKADLISGKVPLNQLPSYVIRAANEVALASIVGEIEKIYITLDKNLIWMWTGTAYVEISPAPAINLYPKVEIISYNWDANNITAVVSVSNMTRPSFSSGSSFDFTVANAIKATGLIVNYNNLNGFALYDHVSGISLASFTFTITIPRATNTATEWTFGESVVFCIWKGTDVGDAPNYIYKPRRITSDGKRISDLIPKQSILSSGNNIKTIEGQSILGAGNIDLSKADIGLNNVDNTSDVDKPISTFQQTALDGKISGTLGGAGQISYSNGTNLVFTNNIFYNSSLARMGVRITSPNSILHVAGSFAGFYRNVTAAFTMDSLDYTIHFTGAGNFVQVLLTAVGITGRIIELVNNSTGTITIQGLSAELVGTANTYKLLPNQSLSIKSSGTNWIIISNGINALSTKNEAGQVKVNYTGLGQSNFVSGTYKQFNIGIGTPTVVALPTTKYPNSTPNNYAGVFDSARNGGTTSFAGRLIENPIAGQSHRWRIIGNYTGRTTLLAETQTLYLRFRNPVSGFTVMGGVITLAPQQATGDFSITCETIADAASIASPNGYIIEAVTTYTDASLSVNILSITRFSDAIEL